MEEVTAHGGGHRPSASPGRPGDLRRGVAHAARAGLMRETKNGQDMEETKEDGEAGAMKREDLSMRALDLLLGPGIPAPAAPRDSAVVLLEEADGSRRVAYAFRDGAPEECDCLSWYAKPHPKAWAARWEIGWKSPEDSVEFGMSRLLPAGRLYRLVAMDCGMSGCPDESRRCRPGHPAPRCMGFQAEGWTHEEPVKCACWNLEPLGPGDLKAALTVEELAALLKTAEDSCRWRYADEDGMPDDMEAEYLVRGAGGYRIACLDSRGRLRDDSGGEPAGLVKWMRLPK